jgi:hypothetical protein
MATTVVVPAVREDTCLPVGELRLHESGQGGAEPYSCLTLLLPHPGQVLPTYLAWAALQLPGVEVEEVPM